MNKTAPTELYRLFLVEALPDPLTPASRHLQIFDNYIAGTRMRIRSIRDPYTNNWTRSLQQRFPVPKGDGTAAKLAEMHLNDTEFALFERFPTNETRKNRYFHDLDGLSVAFDIFLGPLWGLNMARIEFESQKALESYEPAPIFIYEVSSDETFGGANLAASTFNDLKIAFENRERLETRA